MTKLSIKEASTRMGVSPMMLRLMIQNNKLPQDVAFCIKNKGRYYYYINKDKFEKYLKGI